MTATSTAKKPLVVTISPVASSIERSLPAMIAVCWKNFFDVSAEGRQSGGASRSLAQIHVHAAKRASSGPPTGPPTFPFRCPCARGACHVVRQASRPLRAVPDRVPPHRRRAHGALQLALGAEDGRHLRPAHRGHRPGAQHARERGRSSSRDCAGSASTGTRAPTSAGRTARTARWSGSRSTRSSPRSSSRRARRTAATAPRKSSTRSARRSRRRIPKAQFRYPGTCRDRKPTSPIARCVVRFRAPTAGAVTLPRPRLRRGRRRPNSAQQDFVLLRSDGVPLYNFGAVVDDITMGITLVARGRDHMINTPPQILLYEALGATPPAVRAPADDARARRARSSRSATARSRVGEYRDKGIPPRGAPQLPRALRLVARRRGDLLAARARRRSSTGSAAARATASSTRRSSPRSRSST